MIDLLHYKNNLKIRYDDDSSGVYDVLRRKYVILTPEELVRQLFIQYLLIEKNISKKLIAIERQIIVFNNKHRFDLLIFDNEANPLMIIECKSHNEKISQNVAIQISRYNIEIKAPYLCITNGITSLFYQIDFSHDQIIQLQSFPDLLKK